MMSELTQAMIVNGAVLAAVLHTDLGKARKVGPFRIVRPLLMAGAIVPLFIDRPVTQGAGLALELAGTVAGLLGGLAALRLITVYRNPQTGKAASRAGFGYGLLWTLVIGARAAFSYGSSHWFPTQLTHWCMAHQVTGSAITDALIFMAVAMLLTRTLGMAASAAHLPKAQIIPSRPTSGKVATGAHS
jgi:hypothetical protein